MSAYAANAMRCSFSGGCIAKDVPTYADESVSFVYANGTDRWLDEDAA